MYSGVVYYFISYSGRDFIAIFKLCQTHPLRRTLYKNITFIIVKNITWNVQYMSDMGTLVN